MAKFTNQNDLGLLYLLSHSKNIAKGTTDPGVDYLNQQFWFDLVGRVWYVWFRRLAWLFGLVGLVW